MRLRQRSGIILIIVLWILVILAIISLSVARRAHVDIDLVRYSIGKERAESAAWSGFFVALDAIRDKLADQEHSADTLYGLSADYGSSASGENRFQDIAVGNAYYTIGKRVYNESGKEIFLPGLIDEERFLNLNALTGQTAGILKELLSVLGYDEDSAWVAAASIVDWIDTDNAVLHDGDGAESEYYEQLDHPYRCKNAPLDSFDELLLIRGVSQEMIDDLTPFVTVLPKQGSLKVNVNTAGKEVLLAYALYFTGARTNTDHEDAEGFVRKVLEFRAGPDGEERTADDEVVDFRSMPLTSPENVLAAMISPFHSPQTQYFRISVEGRDGNSKIRTAFDAVIDKSHFAVISWKRK